MSNAMKALARALPVVLVVASTLPSWGASVAIANHSFENPDNPVEGFASGDLESLGVPVPAGWTVIATDNNAASNNQEVAVGSKDINPADGTQVLSLMSGAAITQVTSVPWSSLNVGDTLTLTVAVGDRSNTGSEGQPFFTDESYFGLSDGAAGRSGPPNDGAGGPLDPNWITNIAARTPTIAIPPNGYKNPNMGDVILAHTVTPGDVARSGNVGVFIASIGKRDASGLGLSQNYNQGFFDNVRLDLDPVPEPSVVSVMAFGLAALARRRRL